MKHVFGFAAIAAATIAVASPAAAQTNNSARYSQDEEARFDAAQRRFDDEYEQFQAALDRYRRFRGSQGSQPNWNNNPPPARPGYNDDRYDDPNYDPARDYRAGNYQERVLASDDRVYRGNDGRYYCERPDGTTGLIVGAAAGGLFGNVIAGRRSSTVGTLLGAIAGGALGNQVQRNQQQVRCR
ncbi:glycine zipper 2TM domain-containing protein [Sphingomonas sp. IC-56]|uniref:glycine zipper 2TM domain-containing protein n=1 Tax=Sphingomonas sp. IC-56 TaxID=2898529 RepID=UPI001E2A9EB6|nr:glycine zipper 2TM domain-containing protein [Sphingomonas sp. IC-56]MCD2325334.1 glycine zipper 2TM domain-containing protein [Sphingomonas sp. IC-56]